MPVREVFPFLTDEMVGNMLRHALRFLPKYAGGYLYIVLPLKCVTNSRYWTHDTFVECMSHLYCTLTQYHHSQKLAFYLFHWKGIEEDYSCIESAKFPKKLVNDGPGKNNFCIRLE
jgi:25S rRNA (adenine2142-N1)-methyltransferase